MGIVVQFPSRKGGQFTAEMREALVRLAHETPGALPVVFGKDGDGAGFCCFANGLMIGWDRAGRLVLTDTATGFVDRGPFSSLDEICPLVTYLSA